MKKKVLVVISGFIVIMIPIIIWQMQPQAVETHYSPGSTDEPTYHSTSGVEHFFKNVDIKSIDIVYNGDRDKSESVEIVDASKFSELSFVFEKRRFYQQSGDSTIDAPNFVVNLSYVENGFPKTDELIITDEFVSTMNDGRFTCDDMKQFYDELRKFFDACPNHV
ncbi:MAG: hypothetical protein K5639_08090 [Eubacterium sp.]|nr:hypothetical protein [Eubacterium sp.]